MKINSFLRAAPAKSFIGRHDLLHDKIDFGTAVTHRPIHKSFSYADN
jgi:hypothetical protein